MLKKHIVFVWELGGGLGHVAGFSPLAQALINAGYQLSVISQNVTSAAEILDKLPIDIYQAPIYRQHTDKLEVTYSYPEILLDLGYKSSAELMPLVAAWQNLLGLLKPDLVISDHSPSALIACRILNLKKIMIGTGFFSPPHVSPLPLFVGTNLPDQKRLVDHERQMLLSINQVLDKSATPPLKQVYELFHVEEDFLCTFAELDHYPERQNSRYWGPRFDIDIGVNFTWSKSKTSKIFAYIKQDVPGFDALLEALLTSKKNVVLYVPSASKKTKQTCASYKNVVLLNAPANMRQVLEQADMIVCHAGHGVVSAALLHGKRLLLIPSQLEQSMLVYLLAKQRLVAAVNPRNDNNNYPKAIEFACTNAELGKNVELFQKKYAEFDSSKQLAEMVKSCAKILA
ncbi:glycosyltransferase [Paraglaciecola hydrolytica]|uniref:glycosyltransferase n=1 Tax=Paraglaciecola hydrolytica TaxID=1799789 RepID=UPI000ACF0203|nr:glycosyltransferase [Paraglaciecola hydrolytica]